MQESVTLEADPFQGNPAATADLVEKTKEIKRLLALGDQLTETGQYVEARKRLDDVIRIDPYNQAARKKIEKIENERILVANKRYAVSREKAMAKVTEAWVPPLPAKTDNTKTLSTGPAKASRVGEIIKTMAEIRIPKLFFQDKPIREALQALQKFSREKDPEGKGLNFVIRLPPAVEGRDPESATISLDLYDISLQAALGYVCDRVQGGEKLRFEIEDNAVLVLPLSETGTDLETRTYTVSANTISQFEKAQVAIPPGVTPTDLGRLFLSWIGLKIPDGCSQTLFRETGKLVVRNSPKELETIEIFFRNEEDVAQKQFEVETKFLSFTENDVKNFTFNLQMNGNTSIPAPGVPGMPYTPQTASGGTDGLRGTAGLNPGGGSLTALQNLLDSTYPQLASNQVGVNASVFGRGFAAMLQLLQNAIGKDLVAAPRVILSDGKISKINISRRMYYPTSYTAPQIPQNDSGTGSGFVLPSNPTGFISRDLGTTLEVVGEATALPRAVDLDFKSILVEDFEGFIDYGSQISSVDFGTPATALTAAVLPVQTVVGQAPYLVPIFSKKSLQSRVRLLDGQTVGMGGLISDSVQMVDDKVPMLGDIPMLGRFFRSEASQKIKSNLVIFCTLRIINTDGTLVFPDDDTNPEYAQGNSAEMMPSVP
jgi:general secretion pathway protein D